MEFLHQHLLLIVLVSSGVLALGAGALVAHISFGWPHTGGAARGKPGPKSGRRDRLRGKRRGRRGRKSRSNTRLA